MPRFPHNLLLATLLMGTLATVATSQAASSNAPTNTKTNAPADNTATLAVVSPKSRFSSLPGGGKDPFHPDSVRTRRTTTVAQTNQVPVVVVPEVKINGFSGNPALPLVILNNVTFGEGDEQTVMTAAGRAKVRCVQIRTQDQSVVIEINGERRELKFASRK